MTIRVLIIEDDVGIGSLLVRALSKWGFDVTLERNGSQGIERFEHEKYDVALIDGLLPGRNGFAVASRIRALEGGDKIGLVMISAAFRNHQAKNDAHNAGFDAFYAKPFVVSEVREKLVELAGKYTGQKLVAPPAPSRSAPAPAPPGGRSLTRPGIPKAMAMAAAATSGKTSSAQVERNRTVEKAPKDPADDVDLLLGQRADSGKFSSAVRAHVPRRPAFKVNSGSLALEDPAHS